MISRWKVDNVGFLVDIFFKVNFRLVSVKDSKIFLYGDFLLNPLENMCFFEMIVFCWLIVAVCIGDSVKYGVQFHFSTWNDIEHSIFQRVKN